MSSKFIFLSHILSNTTYGYGGQQQFQSRSLQSLKDGHSCNQSEWTLNNHIGTHIDAPFHFSESGKTLDQMSADSWVFERPYLVERTAEPSELIGVESWCESIPFDCDLLILKTGFEKWRNEEKYWAHNPGVAPELGVWLREMRPSLRAIGFDLISLTSYDHRPVGRLAHRAFLHEEGAGSPLMIIEDMQLAELRSSPKKVFVAPMRVERSDGSPVTIIAETK